MRQETVVAGDISSLIMAAMLAHLRWCGFPHYLRYLWHRSQVTIFHPLLPNFTNARVRNEFMGCKEDLTRDFGLDICAFVSPNGYYAGLDVVLTA